MKHKTISFMYKQTLYATFDSEIEYLLLGEIKTLITASNNEKIQEKNIEYIPSFVF